MRKLMFAALCIVMAQAAAAQGRFSVKAGANLFTAKSSNNKLLDYAQAGLGVTAGLGYELPITKIFAVQPELNYSIQSATENYTGGKLKVSYFQVPVLFRAIIPNSKVVLYGGPQVNFLSSAKIDPKTGATTDAKELLNRTDFGVAFGVGHRPAKKGLMFDVRLYNGMGNVFKATYDGGAKTRPVLVSASVGLMF